MPFDNNDNLKKNPVKVNNQTKSMFDNQPKKTSQRDFEKTVDSIEKRKKDYQERAVELTKKLTQLFNDKTLSENKMTFNFSVENEILNDFLILVSEINMDENQNESEGSVIGLAFILRTMLSQKDKINKLEYEISLLKNK